MQKTKYCMKSTNAEKIYCYDSEITTKIITCNICNCKINNKSINLHNKTENHKLAVQLTSLSKKPIEDMKKLF